VKAPPFVKHTPVPPYYVGFDPGMKGGFGVIDATAWFIAGGSLPTTGEGRQGEFDLPRLLGIVRRVSELRIRTLVDQTTPVYVLLEWPQTRPDEAPESSKRFGVGLGLIEGMCWANDLDVARIAPNLWKGRLGLQGKDQDGARQSVEMAEQVIRGLPADVVRGPKGGLRDGPAEALLIAWWKCGETIDGLRNLPEDQRFARLIMGRQGRRRMRT